MNEERIQEIKNAIQEMVQLIFQSGEQITPELELLVSQALEHAANRIIQLRTEESPVEGMTPISPTEPPLNESMPSSNIHSFGYDPENERLLVKFQGQYPQENGPVYGYGGVPENIFELFKKGAIPARTDGKNKWGKWWKGKVPSLGASLYTLIKNGGYPYQKLS